MKELFNEEQLMVLKEIAKNEDLFERVKWWSEKPDGANYCPMSRTVMYSSIKYCKQLCWAIWPDLATKVFNCPCFADKPAKEAAKIILEETKNETF
jgi:hypothetical protein